MSGSPRTNKDLRVLTETDHRFTIGTHLLIFDSAFKSTGRRRRLRTRLASKDLKTRIEGAIGTYNKYRSPEATAELLNIQKDGERFDVSFKGTFCRTCGFYDYFEDLVYEILDEAEIQTRILTVKEEGDTENFRVTYVIED